MADAFDLREHLIATARAMQAAGLNRGTAGNVSVRCGDGFLITPTGMPCDVLTADDIPLLARDGTSEGRRQPSSEWRFHRDLYAARPEAGAVLHAHSPFAVALACLRRDIPPFHYMIARFGGDTIRCADYAIFGSQELSTAAMAALEGRRGCLLANHGQLVAGRDLGRGAGAGDRTGGTVRAVLARLPARPAGAARRRRDGRRAGKVHGLRPAIATASGAAGCFRRIRLLADGGRPHTAMAPCNHPEETP